MNSLASPQNEPSAPLVKLFEGMARWLGIIIVVLTFGGSMFSFGVFLTMLRADVTANANSIGEIRDSQNQLVVLIKALEPANQRFSYADAMNQYLQSRQNKDKGQDFWLAEPKKSPNE